MWPVLLVALATFFDEGDRIMSREHVEKFLSLVKTKESLARKVVALKETLQTNANLSEKEILAREVLPLAKEYGCEFTVEEFIDYSSSVSGELCDDALLNVSGGLSARGVAVGLLVATGLSFVPAVVSSFASGADGGVSCSSAPEISISQSYDQNSDQNVQEGDTVTQQSYDLDETSTAELGVAVGAAADGRRGLRSDVDGGSLSTQHALTDEQQGAVAESDAESDVEFESVAPVVGAAAESSPSAVAASLAQNLVGPSAQVDVAVGDAAVLQNQAAPAAASGSVSYAASSARTPGVPAVGAVMPLSRAAPAGPSVSVSAAPSSALPSAALVGSSAVSPTRAGPAAEVATAVRFAGDGWAWDGTVENLYNCIKDADFDMGRIENKDAWSNSCKNALKNMSIKNDTLQISQWTGSSCGTGANDYKHKAMLKTLAMIMDMDAAGESSAAIKSAVSNVTADADGVKVDANLLLRVQAIK